MKKMFCLVLLSVLIAGCAKDYTTGSVVKAGDIESAVGSANDSRNSTTNYTNSDNTDMNNTISVLNQTLSPKVNKSINKTEFASNKARIEAIAKARARERELERKVRKEVEIEEKDNNANSENTPSNTSSNIMEEYDLKTYGNVSGAAQVSRIIGKAFVLKTEAYFGSDTLVITDNADVSAGDYVKVKGTLTKLTAAQIEDIVGIKSDDYAGKYTVIAMSIDEVSEEEATNTQLKFQ
ncbi:MAG TPA: hypothetical protein VFF28_03735 [Candidatus Nanoarchaeia archaeon]|nr:hypothetical protein [Candidatus Nanoarchaeia archaeon]